MATLNTNRKFNILGKLLWVGDKFQFVPEQHTMTVLLFIASKERRKSTKADFTTFILFMKNEESANLHFLNL